MNVIRKTVDTIIKKPSIVIFMGLVVAVFLVLNFFNPIVPILMGVTSITKSTVFESMVAALQIVSDPGFLPIIVAAVVGGALLASLLGAVIMSGFLFLVNRTLEGLPARKGEFAFGVRKYFGSVFWVNIRTTVLGILFAGFMMVAAVPAVVVTRSAATDRPELMAAAILIDILTVAVILFGTIFFSSYVLFWYPAIFRNVRRAFVTGKRAVDSVFWKVAGTFLIFDIVFATFQYLILIISNPIVKFIISWLFWTVFIIALAVFVFSTFRENAKPADNRQA